LWANIGKRGSLAVVWRLLFGGRRRGTRRGREKQVAEVACKLGSSGVHNLAAFGAPVGLVERWLSSGRLVGNQQSHRAAEYRRKICPSGLARVGKLGECSHSLGRRSAGGLFVCAPLIRRPRAVAWFPAALSSAVGFPVGLLLGV